MAVRVHAVERPDLPPFAMPDRFRHEITYFAVDTSPSGTPLGQGEWRIDRGDAQAILDEGVVRVASPLDSASRAEIELSEEQEAWLTWVVSNNLDRVRLE